ncbi:MIF4-like type 1/2/3 [Penicillium chrysogenum]|uniref:MIF4-like type 1/2/3 n=1 Tax=Penicillium chrysogenum TaxID=5076 RepID=A0ABQ8WUF9_PENCH|nr:MIF4-like type 1/2/3 [Penicillium chrysogenum]KAJ6169405.1 MIF4-like type 1/2/3 [Penicillium chrysogenum]
MSSNPPQSGNQGQSTATPAASTQPASSTPLAATQAPARSYANATKKSATDSTAAPVTVGGSAQHGQSSSVSVNGKPMQNQSQQAASSGVTIVNGAPSASAASSDHSRKPSVTITSSGTSGYMPNGGGPASRPNSLQFGFQQSSPNMGAPAVPASNQAQAGLGAPSTNPRVTSPQTSPSPIPQPASSGGRPPPSTYQAQGNVPNFGSFGESVDANMRSIQASLAHGAQHLRRESSQSTHSDMSNHMGNGPGRSGYQGGRGRGYSQPGYQGQQMPYSPNPGFRQTPNQPRGGPNMGPQFQNQGRPLAPYPNSPHQANRSPALANVNPTTPQMNQVPMAHPQMPQQPYGYGQHMGPQADSWRRPQRNLSSSWRRKDNPPYSPEYPVDLAPESGHFEQFLTMVKFQQSFPNAYDPNYAGYYNPNGGYYMGPPSPQPRAAGMPYNPQYMGQQFPNPMPQATPLSRTPSQVSTDRPGSSLGHGPAPTGPAAPSHTHTGSRASNSPAPKPHFIIPSAKKSPIIIKDPNSGSVKTFEKNPASPARATPSPVKFTPPPTSTPPPRTASASEHTRTESKANATKTDEEKKQELKDAVRLKIQQDEAAQKQRLADEASRKTTEAVSTDAKKDDTEAARAAIEDLSIKDKAEEPKKVEAAEESKETATPAEEPKKAPAPAPAPVDDDEIDFDAIEREMAEIEAKERAAEEDYNRAKQAKKEEAERKEREELENYEANMKKAEAEAEAREIAREKARAGGEAVQDDTKDAFAALKKGGYGATESSTPGDSGAATPVSSDMGPPAKPASAIPKKPAGLKLDTPKPTEPQQATAGMKSLQNAKFLEDLGKVTYPASITPPDATMNAAAPEGRKFHYDRNFLLQFQAAFKDKISVDWDARLRDTVGDPTDTSRPQSARTPSGMGSRAGSRSGPMNTAFPMGNFTGRPGQLPPMGGGPMGSRNASAPFGFPRGAGGMGPIGNIRQHSAGVPPRGNSSKGPRTDSRPKKQGGRQDEAANKSMPLTAGMELKAIQTSASGWKPRSVGQAAGAGAGPAPGGEAYLAPDVVQRKVKAALNKMTPENFDRISGQILAIVSQSKDETDGRTLRQVIQLTFEKATDEAHWAPMYAKFCKSMLESMSPEIKDENIRDRNGTVVAGGSLFRKYLLNRCQEEFERGWKTNLPAKPEGTTEEIAMMSDEYYIAAAAKRRGLGLVKFIGELYKLGMLTERIMHECVKKLVDYEGVPDEAEVESLTSLLRTIGASLDASEKGPAMMDAYFVRIHMMMETPNLPSRLRFMLLDIIDLRAARWNSKDADKGPQTIVEIREAAARAAQAAEAERQRQSSNRGGGGRIPMGRGDARGFGYGNQPPPPDYASSKVGSDDLRRLRATRNTNQPMSFGPSSLLGSRTNSGRKNLGPGGSLVRGSDDSASSSRTGTPTGSKKEDNSSMNAFSALAALEDRDNLATSPPSNPTSPMLTKSQPAAAERRPSKTPSVKDGEAPA